MTVKNDFRLVADRHFPSAKLNSTERLTGGVSADVYRLDLMQSNGEKFQIVLRCHGHTHSGHDAELEFRLLQSLYRSGLPIAEPLGIDTSCDLLEHAYLLMVFVDGTSIGEESSVNECIEAMADTLAAVHKIGTNKLPTLPQRIDPLPELLSVFPSGPEWYELRRRLSQLDNTKFGGRPVLLHGDFWPENLVWREGQIAAILDWEDAAVGDPLSDVACTCLELRYIYGEEGMLRFQQAYEKHRYLEPNKLALWQIYSATAAQYFMGNWGLDPTRETAMRRTAIETIKQAASLILK